MRFVENNGRGGISYGKCEKLWDYLLFLSYYYSQQILLEIVYVDV
jgi:hypothetical protein